MNLLVETFSGIRGVWGESLTPQVCQRYGFAFAEYLLTKSDNPEVVIGMDTRPSSLDVRQALLEGLSAGGVRKIIDVGINSTPATENAVRHFHAAGGVMITASHNQPEFNGFKFLQPTGGVLSAGDAADVIERAKQESTLPLDSQVVDVRQEHNTALQAYLQFVANSSGLTKEHVAAFTGRVIFDINGGANTEAAPEFAKRLDLSATFEGQQPGKFWRLVEPKAESLAPLAEKLQSGEFACAFDCDADRMELVLPHDSEFAKQYGPLVSGQFVVALVVKAILASNIQSRVVPIITNDATSQMVARVADQYGVLVEEVEVGETNVVSLMNKMHSLVGGEGSNGGSIVAPGQCRDGLQALAIILRYLAEQKTTLDEELLNLPNFVTLALKAKCLGSAQQRVRIGMLEHYRTAGARVVTTGGQDGGAKAWVRPDAWVWWRASKTEAGVFRIIADAKDRHTAELLLHEAKETFERLSKV
jgi:phosphomannomutase